MNILPPEYSWRLNTCRRAPDHAPRIRVKKNPSSQQGLAPLRGVVDFFPTSQPSSLPFLFLELKLFCFIPYNQSSFGKYSYFSHTSSDNCMLQRLVLTFNSCYLFSITRSPYLHRKNSQCLPQLPSSRSPTSPLRPLVARRLNWLRMKCLD